jgi:hypothetical protein
MANADLYILQPFVLLHPDGTEQEENGEMFLQQDSAPMHFSHKA